MPPDFFELFALLVILLLVDLWLLPCFNEVLLEEELLALFFEELLLLLPLLF